MIKLIKKKVQSRVDQLIAWAERTTPDLVIGENYLSRWFIAKNIREIDAKHHIPSRAETYINNWSNIYLHKISGSDDDRALHDHPWLNISIILRGSYIEIYHDKEVIRTAGSIVFRRGNTAHRLAVNGGTVWSLFITGPKYREWGFRCSAGWKHWKKFTEYETTGDSTKTGPGCG